MSISSRPSSFVPRFIALCLLVFAAACGSERNDPYPLSERGGNILYSAFVERPKHLDPVQSYVEDEAVFTAQIYEPPLQYHYLKRPYALIPGSAVSVPKPEFYDISGSRLPDGAPSERIAESVYEIRIRPGILYQPHPAFAIDADGVPAYAALDAKTLAGIDSIADFERTGSRELTSDDYIYQVKRLAHPRLHSPIFGLMSGHIVGLKELGERLRQDAKTLPANVWIDLDAYPLEGVTRVDRYAWRVKLVGKYPLFL
jgi:hypothetical protein